MMFGHSVRREMREACSQMREELDDHREAINEGASEISEVREVLGSLDEKIEKLSSRIDELYLLLGAEQSLTTREAALQAFLQTPRHITEIAAFLDESEPHAERTLRSLVLKGIDVYQIPNSKDLVSCNKATLKHNKLDSYF